MALAPKLLVLVMLRSATAANLSRISIAGNKFMRGAAEVLPLGGNYVVKAQPYYPDPEVVRQDAAGFVAGVEAMPYRPTDNRTVVPVVRLSAYMEGAMPDEAGVWDEAWKQKFEGTVAEFAASGVYVFLVIMQDALSTTNGGEGLPWWMFAKMQETAGNVPDCLLCSDSDSYITTPSHPLRSALTDVEVEALKLAGHSPPQVKILDDTDPWLAYSVGGNAGDPRRMNVGNLNMRANNNGVAWSAGILGMTEQVQNSAWRLYRAHAYPTEKAAIFDPFVSFVRYLADVWDRYPNVIAIEMLNEPPFAGIGMRDAFIYSRTALFNFYAAILDELDNDPSPPAPFSFLDVGGSSLKPIFQVLSQTFDLEDISSSAIEKLTSWHAKDQLIVSFHWYPALPTDDQSLQEYISGGLELACRFGNPPVWMSEFWNTPELTEHYLSYGAELGLSAVTYWQYADMNFTQEPGWFKYSEEVRAVGGVVDTNGDINMAGWRLYEPTVADGSFWGAEITGASGARSGLLKSVPQQPASVKPLVTPKAGQCNKDVEDAVDKVAKTSISAAVALLGLVVGQVQHSQGHH